VAITHAASSRRAARSSAIQIAAAVGLSLQQEEDTTTSTAAFVALNPDLTETQFSQWLGALRVIRRQSGLTSIELVRMVSNAQLPAFERSVVGPARPALGPLAPIYPAGRRALYCLASVQVGRVFPELKQLPFWVDVCDLPGIRRVALQAIARGTGSDVALPVFGRTVLAVQVPVYRAHAPVDTVAQRRRAFVGTLVETVLPKVLLASAARGHAGMAIALTYRAYGYQTTFRYGKVPANPEGIMLPLRSGWTASVETPMASSSVFDDVAAEGVLIGGVALSIMLSLLLAVLATSRARAQRMVAEKTVELAHLALHDPLTGLPNRVLALDRAEQLLARARRNNLSIYALYIDIDGFKQINDTFGHATGDEFLKQVAGRLLSTARESDTAARLSGDEFLLLLDTGAPESAPVAIAERLLNVLQQPYDLGERVGRSLALTASIGIAEGRGGSAEQLLADADLAMYSAKTEGKNRYVQFHSEMQSATQERTSLELDLADALDGGQLFLVYQPIFDLGPARMTGVEALLRWRHPERGVIPPDVFIPIAERTGQVIPIGSWVLRQACLQAARWRNEGYELSISVNVSGRQLDENGLLEDVRSALTEASLDPAALVLEITETTLMVDPDAAAQRLAEIKALGVQVAIDDFGTGYCSLAYLRQFPIDSLKIDRSFINAIASSEQADAVIHTLIQLGKTLGIQTVGEGIEDQSQLQHLQAEDCERGQGFLFARPLLAAELATYLLEHAERSKTVA